MGCCESSNHNCDGTIHGIVYPCLPKWSFPHTFGHECVTKLIMGWLKLKWYGLHRWCCNLMWQHMHSHGVSKPVWYMTYGGGQSCAWTLLWMHKRWMILSTLSLHNTSKRWKTAMMTSCGKRGVVIVMALGKNVSVPIHG